MEAVPSVSVTRGQRLSSSASRPMAANHSVNLSPIQAPLEPSWSRAASGLWTSWWLLTFEARSRHAVSAAGVFWPAPCIWLPQARFERKSDLLQCRVPSLMAPHTSSKWLGHAECRAIPALTTASKRATPQDPRCKWGKGEAAAVAGSEP